MHYDLPLLAQFCGELGLSYCASGSALDVHVEATATFRFKNYVENGQPACACGFVESESHDHGEPILFTTDHASLSLTSLDILSGLIDGTLLLWERWRSGQLIVRTLVHKHLREDFEGLESGEEIRVRRIALLQRAPS